MNKPRRVRIFTIVFLVAHTALLVPTALLYTTANDGQAGLLWIPWSFADFPVSMLNSAVNVWWWPVFVHGVFGSIQWVLFGAIVDYLLFNSNRFTQMQGRESEDPK